MKTKDLVWIGLGVGVWYWWATSRRKAPGKAPAGVVDARGGQQFSWALRFAKATPAVVAEDRPKINRGDAIPLSL